MWGKVAAKVGWEVFKTALGKLKSGFGGKKAKITSRKLELPLPGGRSIRYYEKVTEAPVTQGIMTFVNAGAETILTSSITAEAMSKVLAQAGAKELEEPKVRREKTKQRKDTEKLMRTPQVEALPEKENLLFRFFALIAHGDESFHSNAFSEAGKAYRQAYEFAQQLDDKPLQAICLNLIGAALGMQAQHEKALPYLSEAVKLKPDYAEAWNNKGVVLGRLGQHKEALACHDEAVKLKPDFAEAWANKGVALHQLGQHKEALACLDEAVKLKPDSAEAWANKGVALDKLGEHKEALASFDEAVKLKPDYAEAWYNKGVTLSGLGRGEEAIPCFDKAIKVNPDHGRAWAWKGMVHLQLEQIKEARESFEKALPLREQHPDNGGMVFDSLVFLILSEGLGNIASRDMKGVEERALELAQLRKEAEKDGLAQTVDEAIRQFKERLSKRELKLFEEFEDMVTLLAIEDPFERWKVLGKMISEKWPKGVSAVDAIREQRNRWKRQF